ncbi:hypothetical protein Z517_03005 [Fonsecaea pedrosoi CBS 271.37]|uniref:FAD dependent oxidoreductase domain-containing protein n=1 Tax=Fonsecaea pedrosoi CBS 271.37 TaxID=1442368 RepID=A0A0D2HH24_9EURO|nr:uncharacterized protein Z517_03005 [Fonsecaea pedrosoi CBS 271.37]KIW83759.1 hypothetical protein Z517_03005 [Fonsecaea pedrosoi CBS 271.37]
MSLPHPSPLPSFWTSSPDTLRNHRTTDVLPETADVVVVGSGYSGAATTYFLLRNPEARPSTVILEAREACSGASGRNGGHLKPDPHFAISRWQRRYGLKVAKEMSEFEMRQVWDVKKLIEGEKIRCDFELTRAMDVFVDERSAKPAIEAYLQLQRSGFEFSPDLQVILEPERAERISGVRGALAAFTYTAGSVWVLKLVYHLLRRCLEWGANLQTNTPALSISPSRDSEGYYAVETTRGVIRARNIVVATNAHTGALLPEFQGKITPVRGVAARIAIPAGKDKTPHLNNTYSIRFGPGEYDYLIPRSDGSIIVGGAKQVVLSDDSSWLGNSNDSELIPGAEEYFTGYMQRHFRGWESSDARVTHLWTGTMGFSEDLAPWVGELPGKPGVFVEAGFTAHGMPLIYGCAEAIAKLVRGDIQHIGDEDAQIPSPLWITPARLNTQLRLAREHMLGNRTKELAKL